MRGEELVLRGRGEGGARPQPGPRPPAPGQSRETLGWGWILYKPICWHHVLSFALFPFVSKRPHARGQTVFPCPSAGRLPVTIALALPNQSVRRRIRRKNNWFYEKKSVYFSEVDRAPDAGEAEGQRDRHRPDPPAQVGPTPPPPGGRRPGPTWRPAAASPWWPARVAEACGSDVTLVPAPVAIATPMPLPQRRGSAPAGRQRSRVPLDALGARRSGRRSVFGSPRRPVCERRDPRSVRVSVRVRPLRRRRHVHRHELRHQKLQAAAAGQGCLPAGSLRCGNAGLASPRPSAGPSPPPPLTSPRAGSGGRGPGAAVRAPR